jgi:hypothetical protein
MTESFIRRSVASAVRPTTVLSVNSMIMRNFHQTLAESRRTRMRQSNVKTPDDESGGDESLRTITVGP